MSKVILYYVLASYLIGLILFLVEMPKFIKAKEYYVLGIAFLFLVFAPFTAWHGALHYLQVAYCKLTKQPIKYWI
jgi:hypothetical protein